MPELGLVAMMNLRSFHASCLSGALFILLASGCASVSQPPSTPGMPSSAPSGTGEEGASDAESPSGAVATGEGSGGSAEPSVPASPEPLPSTHPGAPAVSDTGDTSGPNDGTAIPGPQTADEKAARLDESLDESLSEFDRMLMREQEKLAEQRGSGGGGPGSDVQAEHGSGATAGEGDGRGGAEGDSGAGDSDTVAETASWGGGGGVPEAEGMTEDPPGDEETSPRVPPDVGDGSDDDVVARQLREAATQEDDPELREALWEEYRKYKAGSSGE